MDLECDICTERFDGSERKPKVLPCGHTACLQCLRRLPGSSCPTCRRDFNDPPEGLITNFLVLKSLEGVRLASTLRLPLLTGEPWAWAALTEAGRLLLEAMFRIAVALWLLLEAMAILLEKVGWPCIRRLFADPPPAEAPPPREMDGNCISDCYPNKQQDKAALLRNAPGVTRLVRVRCDEDPAWSLQLLQRAAPTVERLHVNSPREAHLRALHDMPRLRRLYVHCNQANAQPQLHQLPALPPGHAGLQWLKVKDLPRATLQSLLRAHGGTLEELELGVGTAGSCQWPRSCGVLHSLLQQSGLRALRRLVLLRRRDYSHEPAACSQQRAEVRRVLPGAEVLCGSCDGLEEEAV